MTLLMVVVVLARINDAVMNMTCLRQPNQNI